MTTGYIVVIVMLTIIYLKSMTIGSEFNFILWFRFRKHYSNWYTFLRVPETYKQYLNRTEYKEEK
jgi:hypothetical protein